LVRSRVTDKVGRYSFLVDPGRYYITVTKPKFNFPTEYLKEDKEDVKYLDLYHGETIEVTVKNADITANIPVDPEVAEKPVFKVMLQYYLRKVQYVAAFAAIPLAAVSMVISPGALTFTLFGFHCLLYILFRRLGYQKKPKNWGIVYDKTNKKPLGRAITRIYDKRYNKLLETRVTDGKGRYSFLVNNNIYYVTAEKLGYKPTKTNDIDLAKKDQEAVVGMDIGLDKAKAGEKHNFEQNISTPVSPSTQLKPETKMGVPAKLDDKESSEKPLEQKSTLDSVKPEEKQTEASLEEKLDNLSVGRGSLQELMKSKEKVQDLKEEIEDKKDELEEFEQKVDQAQENIEEKLEKIDQEKPDEQKSKISKQKSKDSEDKVKNPPPEKSIFG